jgi:hypothetical protein
MHGDRAPFSPFILRVAFAIPAFPCLQPPTIPHLSYLTALPFVFLSSFACEPRSRAYLHWCGDETLSPIHATISHTRKIGYSHEDEYAGQHASE